LKVAAKKTKSFVNLFFMCYLYLGYGIVLVSTKVPELDDKKPLLAAGLIPLSVLCGGLGAYYITEPDESNNENSMSIMMQRIIQNGLTGHDNTSDGGNYCCFAAMSLGLFITNTMVEVIWLIYVLEGLNLLDKKPDECLKNPPFLILCASTIGVGLYNALTATLSSLTLIYMDFERYCRPASGKLFKPLDNPSAHADGKACCACCLKTLLNIWETPLLPYDFLPTRGWSTKISILLAIHIFSLAVHLYSQDWAIGKIIDLVGVNNTNPAAKNTESIIATIATVSGLFFAAVIDSIYKVTLLSAKSITRAELKAKPRKKSSQESYSLIEDSSTPDLVTPIKASAPGHPRMPPPLKKRPPTQVETEGENSSNSLYCAIFDCFLHVLIFASLTVTWERSPAFQCLTFSNASQGNFTQCPMVP
jgi:hypothetical protein